MKGRLQMQCESIPMSSRGGDRPCDDPTCQILLSPDKRSYCSVCKSAVYCNKDCQSRHWKMHKPLCKLLVSLPGMEKMMQQRKMMHTILASSSKFIRVFADIHKNDVGVIVCDLNDTLKESKDGVLHYRFKFVAFKDMIIDKTCSLDTFTFAMRCVERGRRVFGIMVDGMIIQYTSYIQQ